MNKMLIPSLMLGVFALLSMELGVMGIIPLIASAYKVSLADAGWVVSIFALIVAVSAPFTPLMLSRFNAKFILLLCLFVFAVSSLLSAFVSDFKLLLVLRALAGLFHPPFIALSFSVASNSVPKDKQISANSKIFAAISSGMTLGVPLTSYLASSINLASSFYFFALVNFIAFLAVLFFVKTKNNTQTNKSTKQLFVLKEPLAYLSMFGVIFSIGAMFGFYSYMSEFFLSFGLDFDLISFALLLYGLTGIFGNILASKFLSLNVRKTILLVPLAMFALYFALFYFMSFLSGFTSELVGLIVISILGVFAGILNTSCHFCLVSPFNDAKELTNGLFVSTANIGTTLGTIVCGMFISYKSSFAVFGALIFILLSFACMYLRKFFIKE